MTEKVLFTWSGGKDSAMSLYELRKGRNYEIIALLTSVTEDYDRISMHGVRRILLEQQEQSLGLLLETVYITKNSSNEEYEARLREKLLQYKSQGVSSVVFGDIFLEDLRKYREDNLAQVGMKGIFPIWKRDTAELARTFIGLGFKAVITCVDSNSLDGKFAGRYFDERFLSELPANVDPCGENGEFHSFVYDGPIFRERIRFRRGKVVLRDNRFYFCDLVPVRAVGATHRVALGGREMKERPVKEYPTLGCCGLDCGLCPRYYTVGTSRCPGCAGPDFFNKHPSCGYITCCVKKKGLEVCAQCDEFPCSKFASWLDKCTMEDSFLTHQKIKSNLYFIKQQGLKRFLEQQRKRIKLLERMLKDFDDGRSKSFYCIATTLLPVTELKALLGEAERKIKVEKVKADDTKTKAKILRESLSSFAAKGGVELKLRHRHRQ